jgi:hypothetical protein
MRTALVRMWGLLCAGLVLSVVADAGQQPTAPAGTIIGELKARQDTKDGKNTLIDVLAPGEEKARRYHVLYDAKTKGPIASVLSAVRKAHVGDRVELEWVSTGHGPAIKSFKLLKKAAAPDK